MFFMDYKKILHDLFKAYYDARRHKRSSMSALAFEIKYESKLFQLGQEIINEAYVIGRSICFICFKPLKREIFAADFRDRIIHHLIYNYINPIFEPLFINDSYSCRVGKGTSYGIKRLSHFIRLYSKNYTKECYILKLDIQGYFMFIDKNILYKKIENKINRINRNNIVDQIWLLNIIHKVIFHDPTKNCIIKGKKEDWNGLPKSKSLFGAESGRGLPIGNLTSQLFGNIYLNEFDHFIKCTLKCEYYGRYVDDMVIVHNDKEYLKSIIPIIRQYLHDELNLTLHPKKIYLQHYAKGVSFLGAVLKPYRMYIRNGTKGNFYSKICHWNHLLMAEGDVGFLEKYGGEFVASMNSYLGCLGQYNTYKLRRKMLTEYLFVGFKKLIHCDTDFRKITLIKCDIIKGK